MKNLIEADNADALSKLLADAVAQKLEASISELGEASLVVSGGSTPAAFFKYLSHKPLAWSKVIVTLADERWVPSDHDDSNEQMVRQQLLQNEAASARFCSLYEGAAHTAEEGALVVAKRVLHEVPMPITVLILGMGTDGHTASLFPDTEGLEHAMSLDNPDTVQIMRPAASPHARITLTRRALLNSQTRILHITGQAKKALIDAIETEAGEKLPIAKFLDQPPITVYWSP